MTNIQQSLRKKTENYPGVLKRFSFFFLMKNLRKFNPVKYDNS